MMVRILVMLLLVAMACAACEPSASRRDDSGTEAASTGQASPDPSAVATDPTPTPTASAPSTPLPPEAIAWIQRNAIPFTTAEPESGFADLQPLKRVVGDARIVALGEPTHGTREFFQMKHRLLEFLVKEMGFTTFAIEATWPESNLVNDYVQTGEGDPVKLLSGLYFWTWNTEEVLDMIRWMRRHNENPGSAPRVSFTGFDMQFPRMAMDNAIDYLRAVDPAAAPVAEEDFACFRNFQSSTGTYRQAEPDTLDRCRAGLQRVYDRLAANQEPYVLRSSPVAFTRALQSARVALQGEHSFSARNPQDGSLRRDQAMADNTAWLLEQAGPDAKIVLWAHNGHVRDVAGWMGSHLRRRFGDEMVIVGFDFYAGRFNAVAWRNGAPAGGLRSHAVELPLAGSYAAYFRSTGLSRFILDVRGAQGGGAATDWLTSLAWMRSIGAVYDEARPTTYFYLASLPKEYDVIVYFEETTPSRLMPLLR